MNSDVPILTSCQMKQEGIHIIDKCVEFIATCYNVDSVLEENKVLSFWVPEVHKPTHQFIIVPVKLNICWNLYANANTLKEQI